MGASYGNIWLPGINSWGMLHDVCDIYTYEKNMCGPIRTHKSRSTNWLINYMLYYLLQWFKHSHKKWIVWKHGPSWKKSLCYVEIYRAAQNAGYDLKKSIAFPEGKKQFSRWFFWMKQRLKWFNLQRDGARNIFSNIKETFAENLQLQMSVLHQSMSIFQGWSLKFIWWLGKI